VLWLHENHDNISMFDVWIRRLNLTYVMFSLCEYVKLSKQTTVQATEVASSLVETIQGACRLGGCFKAMVLMGI